MSAQARLKQYKEEKKEREAQAELDRLEDQDASARMDDEEYTRWRVAKDAENRKRREEDQARKRREEE